MNTTQTVPIYTPLNPRRSRTFRAVRVNGHWTAVDKAKDPQAASVLSWLKGDK